MAKRRRNAAFYDQVFADIPKLKLSLRNPQVVHSYVTYQFMAERRDELLAYCLAREIECKIHYPIPLYCQQGLRQLGYPPGSFPVTDRHARSAITRPVHQYLLQDQLSFVAKTIRDFYRT